MPDAVALDPRKALQDLLAGLIVLVGAQVQASPGTYAADDGLTPAAHALIAEGRSGVAAIEQLAGLFGCQMLPREQRSVPTETNPWMHPVAHQIVRLILEG